MDFSFKRIQIKSIFSGQTLQLILKLLKSPAILVYSKIPLHCPQNTVRLSIHFTSTCQILLSMLIQLNHLQLWGILINFFSFLDKLKADLCFFICVISVILALLFKLLQANPQLKVCSLCKWVNQMIIASTQIYHLLSFKSFKVFSQSLLLAYYFIFQYLATVSLF